VAKDGFITLILQKTTEHRITPYNIAGSGGGGGGGGGKRLKIIPLSQEVIGTVFSGC
jgi:hypothetical protein